METLNILYHLWRNVQQDYWFYIKNDFTRQYYDDHVGAIR
jgi:hypothetical protein